MNFLEYSFYRIYRFQLLVGNHSTPIGTSVIGLTALIMFNFFSLLIIANYFTDFKLLFFDSSKITSLIFFAIILLIVSYSILYKKKYNAIINKYENENRKQKRRGNRHVFIILVLTLLLFYLSLYLLYSKNI